MRHKCGRSCYDNQLSNRLSVQGLPRFAGLPIHDLWGGAEARTEAHQEEYLVHIRCNLRLDFHTPRDDSIQCQTYDRNNDDAILPNSSAGNASFHKIGVIPLSHTRHAQTLSQKRPPKLIILDPLSIFCWIEDHVP